MAAETGAGYAAYSCKLVDSTSRENVEAASLRLTDEEYQQLTSVSEPCLLIPPVTVIGDPVEEHMTISRVGTCLDYVLKLLAIHGS
jgi:hypothetical protein